MISVHFFAKIPNRSSTKIYIPSNVDIIVDLTNYDWSKISFLSDFSIFTPLLLISITIDHDMSNK